MNKLVAIVGMCGSGKSVASEFFTNNGFKCIYFGGVTMNILKENNMEINPNNERLVREKLRNELGMGAFAIKLLPEIESSLNESNVVLDGLYSWDELNILKEKFNDIVTIAIVCDKNIRYDRLTKRDIRPLTIEEAIKRDITEIENLSKAGPIAYADYYINNSYGMDLYLNKLNEIKNKII